MTLIKMKGVILAGGRGSRLSSLTKSIGKHLLPIYDKPMIFYPVELIKKLLIKDTLVVLNKESAGKTIELLGNGENFGLDLYYKIQEQPKGMAQDLSLDENFANGGNIEVLVCDNVFEDIPDISNFKDGARIFLKETQDANKFTVAGLFQDKILRFEEKPNKPKSNYAVTGFYLYDSKVFDYIKKVKPSPRGELELVDVFNEYVKDGKIDYRISSGFWTDTGSFESLYKASEFVKNNPNIFKYD